MAPLPRITSRLVKEGRGGGWRAASTDASSALLERTGGELAAPQGSMLGEWQAFLCVPADIWCREGVGGEREKGTLVS